MKVVFAVDLGIRHLQRARLLDACFKEAIKGVNDRSGATANKQARRFTDALPDKFEPDEVRVAGYTTDAARGDQI